MVNTNLKFALRSLGKYKVYTLINLSGLALGLAAALVIAFYVIDELSYDRQHPQADRIYQLVAERTVPGQEVRRFANLPAPLGDAVESRFPAVEDSFRLTQLGRVDLTYENSGHYEVMIAAEPGIFDFFNYSFISGDPATALTDPNSIVLTETAATKYFGETDPMGKVLVGTRGQNIVTAVIEDLPSTHLQFDVLFAFPPYLESFIPDWPTRWDASPFVTYVRVAEDADPDALASAINDYVRTESPLPNREAYAISLLPLTDIHFQSGDVEGQINFAPGNITTIYTLAAIMAFLVLIACINYTNLATARSINRAHEISLRKLVGAGRPQLMAQFLAEAVVLVLLAFLVAVSIVQVLLPTINAFVGKDLSMAILLEPGVSLSLAALVLLIGVGAGAYPALVLSGQPVSSGLKDNQESSRRANAMRKVLVVAQFSLSVVLVFCTLVIINQMSFIQNKALGFDPDNVIVVDINSQAIRNNAEAIQNELLMQPNVLSVSSSVRIPGDWKEFTQLVATEPGQSSDDGVGLSYIGIDESFVNTFSINLLQGRDIQAASPENSVLVNQALVERMGWESPIGQRLNLSGQPNSSNAATELSATVIGMVEDFHFQSLHQSIGPLVLGNTSLPAQPIDYISVKIAGTQLGTTIDAVQNTVQRHDSLAPFEYNLLDTRMDNFYSSDRMAAILFSVSAGIAIFIACMGLFGLSSFTTAQRRKEIGIRKVLGATIANIVELLSADFMKLVLLAIVIALPLGYYLMALWLQNFAYTGGISISVYIVSALLAVIVSLGTVSVQSVRAALSNPVESIAHE